MSTQITEIPAEKFNNNIAFRFTQSEPSELSFKTIYSNRMAIMKYRLIQGEQLSIEDKEFIMSRIQGQAYKTMYRIMGWQINFSDYLERFVVKQYGQWNEYWSFDKEMLHKHLSELNDVDDVDENDNYFEIIHAPIQE